MIVLDSSTVIEVLHPKDAASHIEPRIFSLEETLHAPHLLDLEFVQVLRRYYASGDIASERGREAMDDLTRIPITRYQHDLLLPRITERKSTWT